MILWADCGWRIDDLGGNTSLINGPSVGEGRRAVGVPACATGCGEVSP
jgi:hypothetical protein